MLCLRTRVLRCRGETDRQTDGQMDGDRGCGPEVSSSSACFIAPVAALQLSCLCCRGGWRQAFSLDPDSMAGAVDRLLGLLSQEIMTGTNSSIFYPIALI